MLNSAVEVLDVAGLLWLSLNEGIAIRLHTPVLRHRFHPITRFSRRGFSRRGGEGGKLTGTLQNYTYISSLSTFCTHDERKKRTSQESGDS